MFYRHSKDVNNADLKTSIENASIVKSAFTGLQSTALLFISLYYYNALQEE